MPNTTQSAQSHAKWDPAFHFVLAPIFLLNAIYHITRLFRVTDLTEAWQNVVAIAMLVAVFKIRIYALKVQDRVIRLEERLRLGKLLPAGKQGLIEKLSEDQLIGLRFASDGELEGLAERAVAEGMDRKQIKAAIKTWRPDEFRV